MLVMYQMRAFAIAVSDRLDDSAMIFVTVFRFWTEMERVAPRTVDLVEAHADGGGEPGVAARCNEACVKVGVGFAPHNR